MTRSSVSAAFFAVACLEGCAGEPAPIERRIAAHSLFGCPVTNDGNLVITPLGDFGGAPAASIEAKRTGPLELRQDFLGIELKIGKEWSGVGYADPPADLDVTLWPSNEGCTVTDQVIKPNRGGIATTSFADGNGLLVAGLSPLGDSSDSAYAMMFDATNGETSKRVAQGLPHGRAFATATPFDDGVLVAGGIDPHDPTDPMGQNPVSAAFVFSADGLEPTTIELGNFARTHHGGITLTNGDTLLVGGVGAGSVVLSNMVAVSPVTRTTRLFNIGTLQQPRKDPVVLRLANGQVLVGGGTDQSNNPVATLEWFAPDGSSCAAPVCPDVNSSLPPRPDLALVALPAGGALAAGAAPAADVFDVWWITPEGAAQPLDPLPRKGARVRLVSASDGAPWAWNGTTWLRFDPWQARFLPAGDAPLDGDGPDDDMPAPVAMDPGLFVWLARESGDATKNARVRGFRHGVRGPLARETVLLLFAETAHLAPDRPPQPRVVSLDSMGLHLAKIFTLTAPRVVVTDTVYGDFDLSAERDPDSALPEIEVGGSRVGSAFCPWPSEGTGGSLSVVRRGKTLEVKVGTAAASCQGPDGRVGIALRAPQFGEAIVRKVTIARH